MARPASAILEGVGKGQPFRLSDLLIDASLFLDYRLPVAASLDGIAMGELREHLRRSHRDAPDASRSRVGFAREYSTALRTPPFDQMLRIRKRFKHEFSRRVEGA